MTSKLITQGYRYHKLRKTFGKFLSSYSKLFYKFGEISFQEYVSEDISHPVFKGDLGLQTQEGKMRSEFLLVGLENRITMCSWKGQ